MISRLLLSVVMMMMVQVSSAGTYLSHPPLRRMPEASTRAMAGGPSLFVDPRTGDDSAAGTRDAPWKTVNHALKQVKPGETLYLRGGTYFENVYCAVKGREEAPITIRSFPGEIAVIDGGIPEFQADPGDAWEPLAGGAEGEFVSRRAYRNIRDVVGRFGDSNVGLQTYWYAMDLRSTNEFRIGDARLMVKPVYCGPGLWYDKESGRIHVRLAHTDLHAPEGSDYTISNYRGEEDPRKLPLVIAPFDSLPLYVDQAMHVRFQDIVFRGGGYRTVQLNFGVNVEFEGCTIYAGTYGLWAKATGPFKMTHCGVYGMIPPWAFRWENSLFTYTPGGYAPFYPDNTGKAVPSPGKRNIARLPTHALLVTEGAYEWDVFHYPYNHDWEISYCEFTDGHDGVYPSGREIRFHHNWVAGMQDDGIYISSPTLNITDKLYVYQNVIGRCTSPIAHHAHGGPNGEIYVFRNVIDGRGKLQYDRPASKEAKGTIVNGSLAFNGHGSFRHMESVYFYQNTLVVPVNNSRHLGSGLFFHPKAALNNLFVYFNGASTGHQDSGYQVLPEWGKEGGCRRDGNLHWSLSAGKAPPGDVLECIRNIPASGEEREKHPQGYSANSLAADPRCVSLGIKLADNDYRLREDSPAAGSGVVLPRGWSDPLRPGDGARPDIGALPRGAEPLRVGIRGRITAGSVESIGLVPAP